MQEGLSPINLTIETEMHRATPGGTGGVKTIGNYAAVSISITASFLIFYFNFPFTLSQIKLGAVSFFPIQFCMGKVVE